MTDPISPAEAAAAAAIDSVNAEHASQSASGTTEANDDLLGADPTDEQIAAASAHAHQLEDQLAAIKVKKAAKKVAAGQGIPHAAPAAPAPIPAAVPQGVVEKPVSYSAQIAALQAEGKTPVKRQYAYQRNRK